MSTNLIVETKEKNITTVCTAKETQRSTGVTCSRVTRNDPTVLKKKKEKSSKTRQSEAKSKGYAKKYYSNNAPLIR